MLLSMHMTVSGTKKTVVTRSKALVPQPALGQGDDVVQDVLTRWLINRDNFRQS